MRKNKQKIIDLKSKEEEKDYDAWVEEISKEIKEN